MLRHPKLGAFVHTPFVYLVLLGLGFGSLWADRKLKTPRIFGKFLNVKLVPDLRTVSLRAVFAEAKKEAGWETAYKTDWDWFVEVQVVNDSETPTTIEDVDVSVTTKGHLFRRKLQARHVEDLSDYRIDNPNADIFDAELDREIPSLISRIRGVPLTNGVGHRGWLRFSLPQVTRSELVKSKIRIWLVDSIDQRHEVHYKRGSDKKWDSSVSIVLGMKTR